MTVTDNPFMAGVGAATAGSSRGARRPEQIFPTLTDAQIARIAAHGRSRPVEQGEVLVAVGERVGRFYVVRSGRIDVVRPTGEGEELGVSHRSGQFTGDIGVLSGRRGLAGLRAAEAGARSSSWTASIWSSAGAKSCCGIRARARSPTASTSTRRSIPSAYVI
jgi:CRP-like cAMP-binding protein